MSWSESITVTGNAAGPFLLYCEPEGAVHEVAPGDVLTINFAAARPHGFEISWSPRGLVLCRLGDSDVEIDDRRGRELRW
jgi:hypothetical protein